MIELPTYPARPINGGALQGALPKVGEWRAEPKFDGWRAFVHPNTGTVFNRHGKLLSITSEFKDALAILPHIFRGEAFEWLDVEALARRHKHAVGSLIVLDAPLSPGTYSERRARLLGSAPPASLVDLALPKSNRVYLTPSFEDGHYLHALMLNFEPLVEGTVWKRADSIYPLQLQSPEKEFPYWIKHRFR